MPFSTIWSIIISIVVLGILVLFHEVGHYSAGRLLGFGIEEFSIGFGPRFFKWKREEIEYSLRLLPLGGYVRFLGEDQSSDDKRAFNNQATWKKMIVLAAGPFMNFVLAILLAVIVLTSFGDYFPVPVIGEIASNSPAEKSGLKVGDRIISVNGQDIKNYDDAARIIQSNKNSNLDIKVKRSETVIQYKVSTYFDENTKTSRIGIVFAQEKRRFAFVESLGASVKWIGFIMQKMVEFLASLFFKGQGANEIMGPVGTIGLIGSVARQGFEMLIRLAILISINLGVVNLLPFPALDGGRLVFLFIEAVRGKPLNQEKEGFIHFAGFIILILLMILFTYKDITR